MASGRVFAGPAGGPVRRVPGAVGAVGVGGDSGGVGGGDVLSMMLIDVILSGDWGTPKTLGARVLTMGRNPMVRRQRMLHL